MKIFTWTLWCRPFSPYPLGPLLLACSSQEGRRCHSQGSSPHTQFCGSVSLHRHKSLWVCGSSGGVWVKHIRAENFESFHFRGKPIFCLLGVNNKWGRLNNVSSFCLKSFLSDKTTKHCADGTGPRAHHANTVTKAPSAGTWSLVQNTKHGQGWSQLSKWC